MNKTQFEAEVNKRITRLRYLMSQVQKIENYQCDIECQSYIPSVNSVIKQMRATSTRIKNLSDSEFASFDFNLYFKTLDQMMEAPEATFLHIKAKGYIPKDPYHQPLIARNSGKKLSKSAQKLLKDSGNEPMEMGQA